MTAQRLRGILARDHDSATIAELLSALRAEDRAETLRECADLAGSHLHKGHSPATCAPCSMASVIEYELRRLADAAGVVVAAQTGGNQ
jgi:hypothetical protein